MTLQDWNAVVGIVAGLATIGATLVAVVTLQVYLKREADTFNNLRWVRWVRKYSWAGLSLLELAIGLTLFVAIAIDSITNPGLASKTYSYWVLCSALISASGLVQLVGDALLRRIDREAVFVAELNRGIIELIYLVEKKHDAMIDAATSNAVTVEEPSLVTLARQIQFKEQLQGASMRLIDLLRKGRG